MIMMIAIKEVKMSELLYIKYNSHRKPQYQLSTRVVLQNSVKKVIKKPIVQAASSQITAIKDNYEKLKKYYKNIKMLPYTVVGDGLEFNYIQGESVLSGINFEKNDIKTICSKLMDIMAELMDINEDYICDFEETDKFKLVFPDKHPSGKAIKICNLDSIFSNFIRTAEGLFCIDYEWVLDFPIPINFIKYRMMHYLYEEHVAYLKNKASFYEFISCLNLEEDEIILYEKMELDFQYLVHGENVKYIYLENYKKRMISNDKAYQLIDSKDEHIDNLNELIASKESVIESKDNHIHNLDDIIETKDSVIRDKEEIIKAKEDIIENKEKTIDAIQEANDKLNKDLIEHSRLLSDKIREVESLSIKLNKVKRSLTNPAYGTYTLCKYACKKIANKLDNIKKVSDERKETKRIEKKAEDDRKKFEELVKYTEGDYEGWITRQESKYTNGELFEYNPLISIVVPVYNVEDRHLIPCIESVKNQTYTNWELILVDDCSSYENVKKTLRKKSRWNKDIHTIFRQENGGISKCTNTGIEASNGEYIAFMDCDDTLAPFALYEVVKKLNEENYDFIYSDEDKINDDGTNRHDPFFKPDWSPDTLMSYMYTSHLGVYKASIVKELNGINAEYDGCQDYDLTLRFTEITQRVGHIPKILYHWRERKESTALNPEAKSYVKDRTEACKKAALERRGISGELEWIDDIYQFRVHYIPEGNPLVSIIIPSKDNPVILEQCLSSLRDKTNYKNYEITIVDNGSNAQNKEVYEMLCAKYKCRYHYEKNDFNFSYMCNTGARISKGEYLLFLNDDIEIRDSIWLERMLGQAELAHVGAVGAKLLYPNTTLIQHDGVISIESGPVHEFAKMDDEESYYFNRNRLDFNVLAVTAACLMVKRDKFDEIGGFDEELPVAYNDIDICMKLVKAGYFNVIRNDAILNHHESISRGDDALDPKKFDRLMKEQEKLYEKHPSFKKKDPFYNPNLVQTDCDSSYNYDIENDYSVSIVDSSQYEIDETIRYGIDIARNDWCIYIEGWAFKEAYDDNINLETKIFLEGKDRSYILKTARVRREDVVKTFSDENCISFCGFKCRIERGKIENGDYTIKVLCNNQLSTLSRINVGSKKNITI